MKNSKIIVPVIFLFVIAIVALGINALYPEFLNQLLDNQPKFVDGTNDNLKMPLNDSNSKSANLNEISDYESVETYTIETMEENVRQWEGKYLSEAGWLHFYYKTTSTVENGVILPDGSLMKQNYFDDNWFLINEQGLVEAHIVRLIDEFGNIMQEEIFKDGRMVNLTTQDVLEGITPYKLKMDLGLSTDMVSMEKSGGKFAYKLEDNQEIYTVVGKYDEPVPMSYSSLPVESSLLSLMFDAETKNFLGAERILQLTDGSEILFVAIGIETVEKTNLPDAILHILEGTK